MALPGSQTSTLQNFQVFLPHNKRKYKRVNGDIEFPCCIQYASHKQKVISRQKKAEKNTGFSKNNDKQKVKTKAYNRLSVR